MLKLGEIRNSRGANHSRKRLGRGQGSGQGATAGKGDKGQKARAGGRVRLGFEGGQMPLYRRVPKRGFHNHFRTEYAIINLDVIDTSGLKVIDLASLKTGGFLKTSKKKLKILGTGDIKKAVTIKADAFSKTAQEKIQKAGGKIEKI